jgi:hypothetical protein
MPEAIKIWLSHSSAEESYYGLSGRAPGSTQDEPYPVVFASPISARPFEGKFGRSS